MARGTSILAQRIRFVDYSQFWRTAPLQFNSRPLSPFLGSTSKGGPIPDPRARVPKPETRENTVPIQMLADALLKFPKQIPCANPDHTVFLFTFFVTEKQTRVE